MKICSSCKINVGGDRKMCPICQSSLMGEASVSYWPEMKKLRLQSFFFKLQLFILLALATVSLALDFLLDLNSGKHWSLLILLWVVTMEMLIRHFLKKSVVVAAIVTDSAIHITLLLIVTGWYLGFLNPIVMYVAPSAIMALLIANLVFSLIDRHGNAIVYLLANILIGVVPYVVMYIIHKDIPITWTICLMVTAITFIGICVFRGKMVTTEIQKRMTL